MSSERLPKIDTYDVLVEPFHVDFTGHIFPACWATIS